MAVSVPVNSSNLQAPDAANAYFMSRYPGYSLVSYRNNEETQSLGVLVLKPLLDGVICPCAADVAVQRPKSGRNGFCPVI